MTTTLPPPPETRDEETTVQDEWQDANTRHLILLLLFARGLRTELWRILDSSEGDMRRLIRDRFPRVGATARGARHMKVLRERLREIRVAAWGRAGAHWTSELRELVTGEPEMMARILETILPVGVTLSKPERSELLRLLREEPALGRTLREWIASARDADVRRIQDQIVIAFTRGESVTQAVRRVVGTSRMGGRDGITERARREVETLTQTTVIHVGETGRTAFYAENETIFTQELYLAVLDGQTTLQCWNLNGKTFPIAEGPHPPVHFQCRSQRFPMLDADALSKLAPTEASQQQILALFAEDEGLDPAPRSLNDLSPRLRVALDTYQRRHLRRVIGRRPSPRTYSDFLRRQSAAYQERVLGRTRARLFRQGKLELSKFVNVRGQRVPLSDLARHHAESFRAAGLDPSAFID